MGDYINWTAGGTFLFGPLSIEPNGKIIMKPSSAQHSVRHALFAAVLAGIALSCLASCSKSAPEAPMERSDVLMRLFGNLDRHENNEALKNVETYRSLDPTNLNLADLEYGIRTSSVISQAKAKLDAGDVAGAAADLNEYCRKYGKDPGDADSAKKDDKDTAVLNAKASVDLLVEAQSLNEKMLQARFSDDVRAAATELSAFAKTNSKLFPKLSAYAASKIKEADARAAVEKSDACAALLQDALDTSAAGRKDEAAVLTALLELNADSAQLAGFESWLSRKPANP